MVQFSPKKLLDKDSLRPSKGLGQNFLINPSVLQEIAEVGKIDSSDTILEIGPGTGNLTAILAQKAKRVIALEKDRRLVEILKKSLVEYNNIEIIEIDALKFGVSDYGLKNYKVIANIPYYITAPLIRKFLEEEKKPEFLVIMIQKEVAQRIMATPPRMNLLAISVQFYGNPRIVRYVSSGNFWPRPRVDSAIIKIIPHSQYVLCNQKEFFEIVKAGFSHPRKQLAGNLSLFFKIPKEKTKGVLKEAGMPVNQRAENLSIEEWIRLLPLFRNP